MVIVARRTISNTVLDITISRDPAITEGPDTINYRLTKGDGEVTCHPVSFGHGNLPATNGSTGKQAIERLFAILDRREEQRTTKSEEQRTDSRGVLDVVCPGSGKQFHPDENQWMPCDTCGGDCR